MGHWLKFRSEMADLVPHLSGRSADVVAKLDAAIGPNTVASVFTKIFDAKLRENAESVSGTGSTIAQVNDTCGNLIQITQLARW